MGRRGPYKKEIKAVDPIVRDVLALIERSGWTDYEVEEVAGVSRAYLSQLRNGRRHDVSLPCIQAICGVFGRQLRIYRTVMGGAAQYGENFKQVRAAREKYSPIWGAWTGELPQPNEWVHLWRYKNLQERTEARAAAMKDPAWLAYIAKGTLLLAEMQSTLLIPASFSPAK